MAFHTRDESGNRIDSDILVSGYIRQQIEVKQNKEIPIELKHLCYQYWLFTACDSWCNKYHELIQIEGDIITIHPKTSGLSGNTITLYGNHTVMNGTSYIWRIKFNKLPYNDSSSYLKRWVNPTIGIIPDNERLDEYAHSADWTTGETGYAFVGGGKYLKSQSLIGEFKRYGEKLDKDNDVIFVHLDLMNHTLGFTINDKYCGNAFEKIEPNNYRLAITFINCTAIANMQFL